jgi:hypothetical protein
MSCSISAGALFDCDNLPQAGVNSRLLVGNLADIETITRDTNRSMVTAITMKTGKAVYAFEGSDMSVKPEYHLVPGTIAPQWTHRIPFVIFDVSTTQKENLESMKNAKLFAITQGVEDDGNGDNYFEIHGLGRGLKLTTLDRIVGDNETLGAFSAVLETYSEGGNESEMPSTFFDTDFDTTLAAATALLTPA